MARKITTIVADCVAQRLTNAEIIAAHPELNPGSIRSLAARARRHPGAVRILVRPGAPVQLPRHLAEALDVEASGRPGFRNGGDLLRHLVQAIVRDNLFDAVLDKD